MFNKFFLTSETRDWIIPASLDYSYDYWLVFLSGLVAVFAASTAFYLVGRVSAATNRPARAAWLVTGAVTMGSGIWSMHFIGMLAMSMQSGIHYDIMLTGLSFIFAIIGSGFAIYFVYKGVGTATRLLCGGVLLGGGIGTMHFVGMAAMQMGATIRYDPVLFGVSVLVAVSLSSVALHLLALSTAPGRTQKHGLKVASGWVMGLSIAAMHYTGMAATYFVPTVSPTMTGLALGGPLMSGVIAAGVFLVTGLALVASFVDRRLEIKTRTAQQSEHFRATVVNNIADGIIVIDQHRIVRMYNPAAARMFGYDPSEIVGKNVSILLASEERETHDEYVRNSHLHEPKILGKNRTLKGQRKDGTTIPLQISVSAMERDEGRMFVGVCHDISERKQAEEALQESEQILQQRVLELEVVRDQLEQRGSELVVLAESLHTARSQAEVATRSKSEFLANMSHELRTPLNAIIGFSEIIKNETFGPVGSTKYREYGSDIHGAGQHLLDLINDILDLSKIEAGGEELHEEEIGILEIIRSVMTLVKGRAEKSDVRLVLDLPDGLPMLRADERKMKQILVNILSNGIKFTEAGGSVTLKIWCRPGSGYVFRITDTGIGMALEDIPKALMPFGQIDSNLSRKYEGTGLGLPLTKHLVEMHSGSLDLQSAKGVGTTVTVRFPAERIVIAETTIQANSA
ncbi:MAG: MHYT domain-containing protein [Dongiaceae bacterium]